MSKSELKNIREAVANYMRSEGCRCCRAPSHEAHAAQLAKLLKVTKYKDGSGYNFSRYENNQP